MKSLFKKKAKKERQRTTRKGWDDYREDAYYNDDYEDSDEYYGDEEIDEDGEYYGEESEGYEDEEEPEEYYEDVEEAGYDEEEDSDEYYGGEEVDEDGEYYGEEPEGYEDEEEPEEYYEDAEEAGYDEEEDSDEYYGDEEVDEDGEYYGTDEYDPEEKESYEDDEKYYEDDEYYEDDDEYYEDDEEYYEDYDEEDYDEDDEYEDDRHSYVASHRRRAHGMKGAVQWFMNLGTTDHVIMFTGLIVVILLVVTGTLYFNARGRQEQIETFAQVGEGLEDIPVIGESGLVAIADAEAARLMAAMEQEQLMEEKQQEEDAKAAGEEVHIFMNITSIQRDMKIKFSNEATGKLFSGVEFEVNIKNSSGGELNKKDDDKDGVIYLTGMKSGKYSITDRSIPSIYSSNVIFLMCCLPIR